MKTSSGNYGWIGAVISAGLISAQAVTVSYPDFTDLSAVQLNGQAATLGNPVNFGGANVLRLTSGLNNGGSAFLKNAIPLVDNQGFNASFSTYFAFQITAPVGIYDEDGQGADGLVFVVQTQANNVGGIGGGIGYSGIANSVGIEFDTWNNGGGDQNNGNHVGIDFNGNMASAKLEPVATRMNDGNIWHAWVDYNGDNDLLEVRLADTANRPAQALLDYIVDLPAILGVPDAFIGFTSGTGSGGGDHDIRTWQFESTYNPIHPQVPDGGTSLGLLGLALAGLSALRRR